MIIDIHAHTFPEAIADKTIANMEKEILKGVEQYMWLHRRFKTRPTEDEPSLYS